MKNRSIILLTYEQETINGIYSFSAANGIFSSVKSGDRRDRI
jgi:hypothetical protein